MTKEGFLTAGAVCLRVGVSTKTLNNWYAWYLDPDMEKPESTPELPMYVQDREKGPRYWSEESVEKLIAFKEWLPKGRNGVMGRFNERYWSKKSKTNSEG